MTTALTAHAAVMDLHTDTLGQALPPWVTCVPIESAPDHRAMYDAATGTETRYMDITAETARRWLTLYNDGKGNRPKKPRTISGYKDDSVNDRWPFIADTISFGRDTAILYDGQHRLEVIAQTGITRRYLVTRGLKPEARPVIDGQAARSLTDAITVSGATAGESAQINALFMSVARRAAYWSVGERLPARSGGQNRTLTKLEIVGFVSERVTEIGHATRRGRYLYRGTTFIPPSIAGFVFWLIEGVDPEQAATFYEQIEQVAALRAAVPENSPVRVLLRRVAASSRPGAPANSKLTEADHLYLLLRTWVLWRHDRTVTAIPLPWVKDKDNKPRPDGALLPNPGAVLKPLSGAAAASNAAGASGGTTAPDDPDADPATPGSEQE